MTASLAKMDAAEALAVDCTDALMMRAEIFTCGEAETVATFLRAFVNGETATAFLASHAVNDEPGDSHAPVFDADGILTGCTTRED